MDVERGVIRNRDYATQVRDFSGLRYGNITPTDIDGMLEYHNKCYIWIETKFDDAELPYGQRLALERQNDDMEQVKPAITIIATHNSEGDIDVANATVAEVRFRKNWSFKFKGKATREVMDRFIKWVDESF